MSGQERLRTAVAGGTAAAAKPSKPESFPAMIEQLKKQVALALPKHMNAERMARIALTEYRKNPKLAECEPASVFASIIIAAQAGLEPGILGQGFLVPYRDNKRNTYICQFIPGWQGLVDLAQRSGRASVWTGAVYDGDTFEYQYGTDPYIKHLPSGEDDPKRLIAVYAVGKVRGAAMPIIEVWPIDKVWKHRDRFNKVGNAHYSFQHAEMYARKIPLLQVLKYMPRSAELSLAMQLDHTGQTDAQRVELKEAIDASFVAGEPTEPGDDQTLEQIKNAASVVELDGVWARAGRNASQEVEAAYHDRREALVEREAIAS